MATKFISITSTAPAVKYIAKALITHLAAGERVLWLVPGGSSIAVAVEVSRQLVDSGHTLSHLTVTLTDERHGEVGHPDSNWRQLAEAGFKLPGATLVPVLAGADLATTAAQFAATLEHELTAANYRLGFFGIGPDGHTAGLLPHSPAIGATTLAAGYDAAALAAAPFRRLTMTAPAIARLDEAVVYARGEVKWPVLAQLATGNLPLAQQPAQALKTVPKLTIFSDWKGAQA